MTKRADSLLLKKIRASSISQWYWYRHKDDEKYFGMSIDEKLRAMRRDYDNSLKIRKINSGLKDKIRAAGIPLYYWVSHQDDYIYLGLGPLERISLMKRHYENKCQNVKTKTAIVNEAWKKLCF